MSRVAHFRPRLTLAVTLVAVCVPGIGVLGAAPAPGDPYVYVIGPISHTAPNNAPLITFAVLKDGTAVDLKTDEAWKQTASGNSRLFLQMAGARQNSRTPAATPRRSPAGEAWRRRSR